MSLNPVPEVWPVIHLLDEATALDNARMALAAGCTGVFVISMEGNDEAIDPVAHAIRELYPRLRVGVNYLSLPAPEALERSLREGHAATWADVPGVRSDEVSASAYALERLLRLRPRARPGEPQHLFFGSVAFKYQAPDPVPGQAAVLATRFGMIPTTSGEATGVAPPARKLSLMRSALDVAFSSSLRSPLALASGVTPDNVSELAPFLTHVLVATGISSDFYTFDEQLIRQLVERLAACLGTTDA